MEMNCHSLLVTEWQLDVLKCTLTCNAMHLECNLMTCYELVTLNYSIMTLTMLLINNQSIQSIWIKLWNFWLTFNCVEYILFIYSRMNVKSINIIFVIINNVRWKVLDLLQLISDIDIVYHIKAQIIITIMELCSGTHIHYWSEGKHFPSNYDTHVCK